MIGRIPTPRSGKDLKRHIRRLNRAIKPLTNLQGDGKNIALRKGAGGVFLKFTGAIYKRAYFGCVPLPSAVRVYWGYFMIVGYGVWRVPAGDDYTDVAVTGNGHIIARAPTSDPGSVSLVFQGSPPDVSAGSSYYERLVCSLQLTGTKVFIEKQRLSNIEIGATL